MTNSRTTLLGVLVAFALLVTGAVGGEAVATSKIKGKQIAKNAIATKHLRTGAVTGDKIAGGTVTGDKLAGRTVTGDKLAANTVTGSQIDEATLGRVPDSAAIAGATVSPISLVLPNTHVGEVPVATGPGWSVDVQCSGAQLGVAVEKTGSAALVTAKFTGTSGTSLVRVLPGTGAITLFSTYEDLRVESITAGTATTSVDLTAVFSAGQFTSQTDCFFRGTVTSTP